MTPGLPRCMKTEDHIPPLNGGDWVSVPPDGSHIKRLRDILALTGPYGIMISTRGDYYLLADDQWAYILRNDGAAFECACDEPRDGTGACAHMWALRAIRGEFFPDWEPKPAEEST